jgi:hypothetical protein
MPLLPPPLRSAFMPLFFFFFFFFSIRARHYKSAKSVFLIRAKRHATLPHATSARGADVIIHIPIFRHHFDTDTMPFQALRCEKHGYAAATPMRMPPHDNSASSPFCLFACRLSRLPFFPPPSRPPPSPPSFSSRERAAARRRRPRGEQMLCPPRQPNGECADWHSDAEYTA